MKKQNQPPKRKYNLKTLKRIFKMLFSSYPVLMPLTVVCIIFSAVTSSIPAIFIQKVIEGIETWQKVGDWATAKTEIIPAVMLLLTFYVLSILAITLYTQLMAYMTQGFLAKAR